MVASVYFTSAVNIGQLLAQQNDEAEFQVHKLVSLHRLLMRRRPF